MLLVLECFDFKACNDLITTCQTIYYRIGNGVIIIIVYIDWIEPYYVYSPGWRNKVVNFSKKDPIYLTEF